MPRWDQIYTVANGGHTYKVYNANQKLAVTLPIGTVADDDLANNYIMQNIDEMTISVSGQNLVINFTPCEDQDLLNKIELGQTKIRLQLLNHKITKCGSGEDALKLAPGYYWVNHDYPQGKSHWRHVKGTAQSCPSAHIDLTKAQLLAGSAVLAGALQHAKPYAALKYLRTKRKDASTIIITNTQLTVEMYCPALYRRAKDIFYYERNKKYRVADNYVTVPSVKAE